jgi:hypothetical protein
MARTGVDVDGVGGPEIAVKFLRLEIFETNDFNTHDTVNRTLFFRLPSHPPNIKNRDVPHLRQNVLQLFAVFFTLMCVHHQAGSAIPFLHVCLEGLQVLVTKLSISRDGVSKTVIVR